MNLKFFLKSDLSAAPGRARAGGSVRPGVLLLLGAMAAILLLAVLLKSKRGEPSTTEVEASDATPGTEAGAASAPVRSSRPAFKLAAPRATAPANEPVSPAEPKTASRLIDLENLPRTEETARAAGVINSLLRLNSTNALDDIQARTVRAHLKQIAALGAPAAAAIYDFLQQTNDASFGKKAEASAGADGTPSTLRAGLIDALSQITGPEAVSVAAATLQKTTAPGEIGALFRMLDQQAPGEFSSLALDVTREALHGMSQKGNPEDVAVLFQVLQKHGDGSVIPELQNLSGQYRYYSLMALSGLPEGQGVPSLVQMATGPGAQASGYQQIALQLLAQSAPGNAAAQSTLIEQARQGQIPNWPDVAAALAGSKLQFEQDYFSKDKSAMLSTPEAVALTHHVPEGNQHWRTVQAPIPADQLDRNIGLVDQLLSLTTDPAGQQALQRAKAILAKQKGG